MDGIQEYGKCCRCIGACKKSILPRDTYVDTYLRLISEIFIVTGLTLVELDGYCYTTLKDEIALNQYFSTSIILFSVMIILIIIKQHISQTRVFFFALFWLAHIMTRHVPFIHYYYVLIDGVICNRAIATNRG